MWDHFPTLYQTHTLEDKQNYVQLWISFPWWIFLMTLVFELVKTLAQLEKEIPQLQQMIPSFVLEET